MEVPEEEMYAELKKKADNKKTQEILSTDTNPILYVRNVPSTDFYLILQDTVVVCSGHEGFLVQLGPF